MRVPLRIGTPRFFLELGPEKKCEHRLGPHWGTAGETYQLASVVSPRAGGAVRSYWLIRNELWVRPPAYEGRWPELDRYVTLATGLRVREGEP